MISDRMKRTAQSGLLMIVLAALLLVAAVGHVNAAYIEYFPRTVTPEPRSEPAQATSPSHVPYLQAAPRYGPNPPPLIQTPVIVTGPGITPAPQMAAEDWKEWPILPVNISPEMRRVYQNGLRRGTNPNAFSIIGDCQSQPEVFMGVFDTDPRSLRLLPAYLRETARHFDGSFGRQSPTVQDGITAGAVLWGEWANQYQRGRVCQPGETPLTCELRLNNPSIVFIHIGTHWEARNERYLTLIIETVKAHGAVPIMVTKADNREQDERINLQSVRVAQEQGIPVWNFWASVQHTPNQGLEDGNNMFLNEQAIEIHRYSALQVLDLVWRAVK